MCFGALILKDFWQLTDGSWKKRFLFWKKKRSQKKRFLHFYVCNTDTLQMVGIWHFQNSFFENANSQIPWPHHQNWRIAPDFSNPSQFLGLAILILAILILAIVTPFWLGKERGWVQLQHVQMMFQWPWCPQWVSSNDQHVEVAMLRSCDHVVCSGRKCVGMQGRRSRKVVKWFAGGMHALPTDHNGDVPNGYAWQAQTPLRWWCDWIPILAIPILVIHPDRDPIFSDPNLGNELKESDNWHF
jgi:hypothetical protein